MYNKTTSVNFLQFGKISDSFKDNLNLKKETITQTSDFCSSLTRYNENVYVELTEGMALCRIVNDPEYDSIQTYAVHRNIRINKGNYFAIVPMTGKIVYNLYYIPGTKSSSYKLETPYPFKRIIPTIQIKEIVAYYYVVKSPNYHFPGEAHEYFELTYVDHGSLFTDVGTNNYTIGSNSCMIYGPNQWHDQKVVSADSCSYLTVIFDASGIDEKILNRVYSCSRFLVQMIDSFVKASDQNIQYRYDAMICNLQNFIISLLQVDSTEQTKPTPPINQHFEDRLLEEIITFINQHLYEPLPIEQICQEFSISRSTLQNLFKNNMQIAPKQYINETKLSRSRVLIRKSEHTISEISSMLGFTSIHYFSRKFTQRYGITPSEYSKKIYDEDAGASISQRQNGKEM